MFSNRHSSSNSNHKHNHYNQFLLPTNLPYESHYRSAPNVVLLFENEIEQRRLSDVGPSLRLPNSNLYYPGELGRSESDTFKQRNSSLTTLLDSTTSIMRTASTTFHCLIGSARRASYCGQPDPSIQLSSHGNSGSLYLLPTGANSSESSISNISYEEKRRNITIYDGRVPAAPSTPTIPFELMAPIDLITQTVEDPVESFVQIVLEEPDDRPPMAPPTSSSSSSRRNSGGRRRRQHRSSSPKSTSINRRLSSSENQLNETQTVSALDVLNSLKTHYRAPEVVEPMDFSFLDPVLRGESAAPPTKHLQKLEQNSPQNSSITEDLSIDIRLPIHINNLRIDNSTSSEIGSDVNNETYSTNQRNISTSHLKIPTSAD